MKRTFLLFLGVGFLFLVLFLLQKLLMPKYFLDIPEGALISEYYEEDRNHDVLFIGDCEVYTNFSPKILWEEYGIHSYIRGSASQHIWHSYYLLKEMLKEEKPKAIVFNVLAMKYGSPTKEEYNRMTLDGMKWSKEKVDAVLASMLPSEYFIEYVFPLLRFHSRWSELSENDFKYLFSKKKVSHNGYLMNADIRAVGSIPVGKPLGDYSFSKTSYQYLDKMNELCKKNGAELVLIKAPILYPYWYEEWNIQIETYAKSRGLRFINFLESVEKTGIDFTKDTYDRGLHLNVYGAEKLSRYLGEILKDELGLKDRREEKKLALIWEKKISAYENEKKELEKDRVIE